MTNLIQFNICNAIEGRKSCRAYLNQNVNHVTIEKNMPKGSWIDAGMFIQNILLASQEFGLATCPQAAFAEYHVNSYRTKQKLHISNHKLRETSYLTQSIEKSL